MKSGKDGQRGIRVPAIAVLLLERPPGQLVVVPGGVGAADGSDVVCDLDVAECHPLVVGGSRRDFGPDVGKYLLDGEALPGGAVLRPVGADLGVVLVGLLLGHVPAGGAGVDPEAGGDVRLLE